MKNNNQNIKNYSTEKLIILTLGNFCFNIFFALFIFVIIVVIVGHILLVAILIVGDDDDAVVREGYVLGVAVGAFNGVLLGEADNRRLYKVTLILRLT